MYPEDLPRKKFVAFSKRAKHGVDRKIVGVIVFDGEKFLLLHRVLNWVGWEFPKGGIDAGESALEAVGRELLEETGIPKFEFVGEVDDNKFYDCVHNRDVFIKTFLVRVSSNNKISFDNQAIEKGEKLIEHDDYKWCFPGEAVKLLTHKNSKDSMKRAIQMLNLSLEK